MSNKIVKLSKNNKYYIAISHKIKILEELLLTNINLYTYRDDFYINFNAIIEYYEINDPAQYIQTNGTHCIKINNNILIDAEGFYCLQYEKKIKKRKIKDKAINNTLDELFEILSDIFNNSYAEDTIYTPNIKKIDGQSSDLIGEQTSEQTSDLIGEQNIYEEKYINLETEFKMLRNINESEKIRLAEIKDQFDSINIEYGNALFDCNKKDQELKALQNKYNELKDDYDDIKIIATDLAKYVRINNKDVQNAYSDHFDIDDDFVSEQDKKNINKNAQYAKQKLNNNKIKCNKISKVNINTNIKNNIISLMRSSYVVDNYNYKWEMSSGISDEFKEESENYLLDDDKPPAVMVWYCDLSLSNEKIQAVNLFFDLIDNICNEQTIVKLLD